MFLSTNDDKNQINGLNLYNLKIFNEELEFKNKNLKIIIPLNQILFLNKKIFFKPNQIKNEINNFYKEKFSSVLERISSYSDNNEFVKNYGYVFLTSRKIKSENSENFYTTHNAVIIVPNQDDIITNPTVNLSVVKAKITENYSIMLNNPNHVIEEQNFDSSYNFKFEWKTEGINSPVVQENAVYASLTKEGVYLSSKEEKDVYNFIEATKYDQYINCMGNNFNNKTYFLKTNKGLLKVNNLNCCVEFDKSSYDKPYKEMYCSLLEDANKCSIEINIFKHFFLKRCMENGIENLLKGIKNNFTNYFSDLTPLSKISLYSLVVNLKKMEKINILEKFQDKFFKNNIDYNITKDNLNPLFIKSLKFVGDIDLDKVLNHNKNFPAQFYLTNKFVKIKLEELKKLEKEYDMSKFNVIKYVSEKNKNDKILESNKKNIKDIPKNQVINGEVKHNSDDLNLFLEMNVKSFS